MDTMARSNKCSHFTRPVTGGSPVNGVESPFAPHSLPGPASGGVAARDDAIPLMPEGIRLFRPSNRKMCQHVGTLVRCTDDIGKN
jgi:hypothetical protein